MLIFWFVSGVFTKTNPKNEYIKKSLYIKAKNAWTTGLAMTKMLCVREPHAKIYIHGNCMQGHVYSMPYRVNEDLL